MENLDCHLVRVPFESLKRAAKDRKSTVDDVSEVTSSSSITQLIAEQHLHKNVQHQRSGSTCDAMQTDGIGGGGGGASLGQQKLGGITGAALPDGQESCDAMQVHSSAAVD